MRMRKDVAHPQRLPVEETEHVVEDQPGHEHRSEETRQKSDRQTYREPFHRPVAEVHQNHRAEQCGQIAVQHGGEGLFIPEIDRAGQCLAGIQLLADAFEDQHVGVDRHAEGEDDSGDAGHGHRRTERGHRTEDEHHVDRQRRHRDHPRPEVVDAHESREQHHREDSGEDAVVHVVRAERRSGVEDRVDLDLEGETAAGQRVGDVLRLLVGEAAGDLRTAASDAPLDHRSTVEFTVEHNRQPPADVPAGHFAEPLCTGGVEEERNLGLTELVAHRARLGDRTAVHLRPPGDQKIFGHGAAFVAGGHHLVSGRRHDASG